MTDVQTGFPSSFRREAPLVQLDWASLWITVKISLPPNNNRYKDSFFGTFTKGNVLGNSTFTIGNILVNVCNFLVFLLEMIFFKESKCQKNLWDKIISKVFSRAVRSKVIVGKLIFCCSLSGFSRPICTVFSYHYRVYHQKLFKWFFTENPVEKFQNEFLFFSFFPYIYVYIYLYIYI